MTPFLPVYSNPNPTPSNGDLRTTVSLIKDLAAQAETTLCSITTFFSSSSASAEDQPFPDPVFCRCPYDPRHRMQPESLFRHFLGCPSSPAVLDLGFLETLRYPNSLKSEAEFRCENRFVQPLPKSEADLCFSLDKEFGDVGSSFFYKDCPGVVTFPEPDGSSKTFTLPGILSVECANFVCSGDREIGVSRGESVGILPSELWALRCEVKAWKDYPLRYSYTAARVVSCMWGVGDCGLLKWVISNSPRYGILIDMAMGDHIYLLLKLCLKAIWREAVGSLELISNNYGFLDPRSLSLECPCLVGGLTWLASQLSILYGGSNGKFFTIGMLAEYLIRVGSTLSLFPLDEHNSKGEAYGSKLDADVSDRGSETKASEDVNLVKHSENGSGAQVFVSQIAAAVAALHERSLLEDRIKVLRFAQPLSKSQLISDHLYASTMANEERAKRPNYRAVLEHDGLLWQRSQNQDSAKAKTREELLAEDRDYKRRRMSYRGKKVKRTTTQVMRDIIEKHMEEIKQAGGIGCNVKGAADTEMSLPGSYFQSNITVDVHEVENSGRDSSEASIRDSHINRKPLYPEHNVRTRMLEDVYNKNKFSTSHDLKNTPQKLRCTHRETQKNCKRSVSMDESHTIYGSRSSLNNRNYRESNDQHAHQREQVDVEVTGSRYENSSASSHWPKDCTSRSTLGSNTAKDLTKGEYTYITESKSRNGGRNIDSRRSESATQNAFGDRYDPSDSYDKYGDVYTDDSSSSKYSPTIDANDYNDMQRYNDSIKKRHRDHRKKA